MSICAPLKMNVSTIDRYEKRREPKRCDVINSKSRTPLKHYRMNLFYVFFNAKPIADPNTYHQIHSFRTYLASSHITLMLVCICSPLFLIFFFFYSPTEIEKQQQSTKMPNNCSIVIIGSSGVRPLCHT